MTNDDLDQPTVAQRLSPRARTSMAQGSAGAGDPGDEPTVAFVSQPSVAQPAQQAQPDPAAPVSQNGSSVETATSIVRLFDRIPERVLVRAATPLLLLIAHLRSAIDRADVVSLRREVVAEIDKFEQTAQKEGVEAGDIIAARYVLCATVDETVLMTPWGSRSEWSSNSLLNEFHNETWGGEKFFGILDRIKGDAPRKMHLLVLLHACLMLGFEGRYRVLEGGRDQLEDMRNELSRLIKRNTRVKPDQPLSKVSEGHTGGRKVSVLPPIWIIGIIAVSILFVAWAYSDFMLEGEIVPPLSAIEALEVK
jgi:type VI secretion system protein ImpK